MYVAPFRSEKFNEIISTPEDEVDFYPAFFSGLIVLSFVVVVAVGIATSSIGWALLSVAGIWMASGIVPFALRRKLCYSISDSYSGVIFEMNESYQTMTKSDRRLYRSLMKDIYRNLHRSDYDADARDDIISATRLFELKREIKVKKDLKELIKNETKIALDTKEIMKQFGDK